MYTPVGQLGTGLGLKLKGGGNKSPIPIHCRAWTGGTGLSLRPRPLEQAGRGGREEGEEGRGGIGITAYFLLAAAFPSPQLHVNKRLGILSNILSSA